MRYIVLLAGRRAGRPSPIRDDNLARVLQRLLEDGDLSSANDLRTSGQGSSLMQTANWKSSNAPSSDAAAWIWPLFMQQHRASTAGTCCRYGMHICLPNASRWTGLDHDIGRTYRAAALPRETVSPTVGSTARGIMCSPEAGRQTLLDSPAGLAETWTRSFFATGICNPDSSRTSVSRQQQTEWSHMSQRDLPFDVPGDSEWRALLIQSLG